MKHIFTSALLSSIPELTALSCHEIKAREGKHTIGGKYRLNLTSNNTIIDIIIVIFGLDQL